MIKLFVNNILILLLLKPFAKCGTWDRCGIFGNGYRGRGRGNLERGHLR